MSKASENVIFWRFWIKHSLDPAQRWSGSRQRRTTLPSGCTLCMHAKPRRVTWIASVLSLLVREPNALADLDSAGKFFAPSLRRCALVAAAVSARGRCIHSHALHLARGVPSHALDNEPDCILRAPSTLFAALRSSQTIMSMTNRSRAAAR